MSSTLLLRRRTIQSKKDSILTFTAAADNSSVQLTAVGSPTAISLEYKTEGSGWLPYTVGDVISLPRTGDYVKMRGVNNTFTTIDNNYYKYNLTGSIAASGDVTSLLNGKGGDVVLSPRVFNKLFENSTSLVSAPSLPSTTLAEYCYDGMFYGCTSLTEAPSLPATTLAINCYAGMFYGCTSLTKAPLLPATTMVANCYQGMFHSCDRLTEAPRLPATVLAPSCYSGMFRDTRLSEAPLLPAVVLADGCYSGMFFSCGQLDTTPPLPATTLAPDCYSGMFQNSYVQHYEFATINDSGDILGLRALSFTIHADTPPEIGMTSIRSLPSSCVIYVPAASVDAYKSARYWRDYANTIQAIPE